MGSPPASLLSSRVRLPLRPLQACCLTLNCSSCYLSSVTQSPQLRIPYHTIKCVHLCAVFSRGRLVTPHFYVGCAPPPPPHGNQSRHTPRIPARTHTRARAHARTHTRAQRTHIPPNPIPMLDVSKCICVLSFVNGISQCIFPPK